MKKLELTNEQILNKYIVFSEKTDIKSTNFNYFKLQNKMAIQKQALPLEETQKEVNSHVEDFQKEYHELLKKYANKDAEGEPVVKSQTNNFVQYDISPENIKKIASEAKKLQEGKYKKNFALFEKSKNAFEKILQEKQTVSLHTIKKKDLPDNLNDFILEQIYELIE